MKETFIAISYLLVPLDSKSKVFLFPNSVVWTFYRVGRFQDRIQFFLYLTDFLFLTKLIVDTEYVRVYILSDVIRGRTV